MECIPQCFKMGHTLTLHKGKGKSCKGQRNHRAVSFLNYSKRLLWKDYTVEI